MKKINFSEIGKRIKERRKAMGFTQKQLGELVGLSEGSISRYEHGKVEEATTATITAFANVLQVSPIWIMGLEERGVDVRLTDIMREAEGIPDHILQRYLDFLEDSIKIYKEVTYGKL